MDNLAAGLGFHADSLAVLTIFLISVLINTATIQAGSLIGRKVASHTSLNFFWFGAFILILLAFFRLFQ